MFKKLLFVLLIILPLELPAQTPTAPVEVWEPAVAGFFYPKEPEKLKDTVNKLLSSVPQKELEGRPMALISPHAGYDYSGEVAAYGYNAIREKGYKRIIVLAPSHYGKKYRGVSILNANYYKTPLGQIEIDQEVCTKLVEHPPYFEGHNALFGHYQGAYKNEHSIETQLPFLQTVVGDFKLVPILLGPVLMKEDLHKIAEALKPFIDENTLVVASSDFTHYGDRFGYTPFRSNIEENLKKLDFGAIEKILAKDFDGYLQYKEETNITICGLYPIALLLKLLPAEAQGSLLKYDTSGRMEGDFTRSVSYVSIAFTTPGKKTGKTLDRQYNNSSYVYGRKDDFPRSGPAILLVGESHTSPDELTTEEGHTLLSLARTTLESYTRNRRLPEVQTTALTPKLKEHRGVFVTLHKNGGLRGCIGHIIPRCPLWQAVMENAMNSAFKDARFPPLRAEELTEIEVEISVLSPLRKINGPEEFQVGKEGVLIKLVDNNAVFLPQVATEQGWTRDETLCQLCRKAGLPWYAWWSKDMEFYVFTTEVFREPSSHRKHAGFGR